VVKLVPTTVEQKVPVRRLVECPGFQTVNESYVEYEDREAVREKEVWVKRIVPERYVERVSVQMGSLAVGKCAPAKGGGLRRSLSPCFDSVRLFAVPCRRCARCRSRRR